MTPDAFLHAILESPDDDLPRLAYADWLEEQGDPRGEFIHAQLWLARAGPDDPARPALEARARQLLDTHARDWLGPLAHSAVRWAFRRGFLDAVAVAPQVYLDPHWPDLPRPPTLRKVVVELTGFTPSPEVAEYVPASVAVENGILPLGWRGETLALAMRDPADFDTLQKLEFILNREIEPVPAAGEQVLEAIERTYAQIETESVESMLAEFVDVAVEFPGPEPLAETDLPVVRLVNLVLHEAVHLHATQVAIDPLPDCVRVRYRIDGAWVERDRPPRRLLGPIVARLRQMADLGPGAGRRQSGHVRLSVGGVPRPVTVRIRRTPAGPCVALTL